MIKKDILKNKIQNIFEICDKYQVSLSHDKVYSKLIEELEPLSIRDTDGYKESIVYLLENWEDFLENKPWRKSMCSSLLGFDIKGGIEDIFDNVEDKEAFVKSFLIFKTNSQFKYINERFEVIKDFFLYCLKDNFLNKNLLDDSELNKILDSDKNDLEKRVAELNNIIEKIDSYIGVSVAEKKNFGEVFTPMALVNEMLDTLPSDVWTNPDLKWLDSCVGIGNFPVVIVQRLMKGLKNWEKDEEKRYKHILENMIYVCDISTKNLFIYLNLFDREHKYNMNYHFGSFLEKGFDDKMKEWGVNKFDIVVGNPPYHEQVGPTKTQQIWGKMTCKMFDLLVEGGYMNLVHPGGWRTIAPRSMKEIRKVNKIYTTNKVISAKFYNYSEGEKVFSASTDFDLMCVKKEKSNGDCIITTKTDGDYKTNINGMKVIPTDNFKLFDILKGDTHSTRVDVLFSTSDYHARKNTISKEKNSKFKYPVIYGYPKKGLKLIYSNTKDNGHYNIPKLILVAASINSILDVNGEYAMTEYAGAIVDTTSNLKEIQKVVDSDNFKQLKGYFLGIVSQNRNASIDATRHMFKYIKLFKKDFWKEFESIKLMTENKIVKIEKYVGDNINKNDKLFNIGDIYEYTGKSKKITTKKVKVIKQLKNKVRIKDEFGNVVDVTPSTIKEIL